MLPETALEIAVRIGSVGLLVGSAETLSQLARFRDDHQLFRGDALAVLGSAPVSALRVRSVLTAAHVALAASALVLITIGPFNTVGRTALLLATLTQIWTRSRRRIGGDGADQLLSIVFIATSIAALSNTQAIEQLAVLFIAGQVGLAYISAGVAKAIARMWRDGSAIVAVLGTSHHGLPSFGQFLQRHPVAAKVLSWTVILFECTFVPVLLVGPTWMGGIVLIAGLTFHVACALLMGLNSFIWAFPATYGCVALAATWCNELFG